MKHLFPRIVSIALILLIGSILYCLWNRYKISLEFENLRIKMQHNLNETSNLIQERQDSLKNWNGKIDTLNIVLQKTHIFSLKSQEIFQSELYFLDHKKKDYTKIDKDNFSIIDFKGRLISKPIGSFEYHLAGATDFEAVCNVNFNESGIEIRNFKFEFDFEEKTWGALSIINPPDSHKYRYKYNMSSNDLVNVKNINKTLLLKDKSVEDSLLGDSLWVSSLEIKSVDSILFRFQVKRKTAHSDSLNFNINGTLILSCPELVRFHNYSNDILDKMN